MLSASYLSWCWCRSIALLTPCFDWLKAQNLSSTFSRWKLSFLSKTYGSCVGIGKVKSVKWNKMCHQRFLSENKKVSNKYYLQWGLSWGLQLVYPRCFFSLISYHYLLKKTSFLNWKHVSEWWRIHYLMTRDNSWVSFLFDSRQFSISSLKEGSW